MKRLFAILAEPASYTVDRNKYVYDKLGIDYAYMHSNSAARAENVATVRSYDQLSFAALLKEMCRILKAYDGVIMNGYNNRTFAALFLANFFYCRPIGIDSDTQLVIPKQLLKRILKKFYLRFLFSRRWMYGLAGGSYSHKELFRHYGMDEDRIMLMPMMVNNERFYYTKERQRAPFTFLFVGRLVAYKHAPLLVEAFIKAFSEDDKVQLRIVGKGEDMTNIQELSAGYNNISIVGAKFGNELIEEYRRAHVFVLPSTYEQWGLVVNEALSASMPVIVSDTVGSGYDLVEGRRTGLIFKDNDVDSLAECLKTIAADEALYREYSRNAYKLMYDYWNYDLYTECLKDFINAI